MRCEYEPTIPKTRRWRCGRDEADPRCLREGRHHHRGGWFCTDHVVMIDRDHRRILERIRSIPPRHAI